MTKTMARPCFLLLVSARTFYPSISLPNPSPERIQPHCRKEGRVKIEACAYFLNHFDSFAFSQVHVCTTNRIKAYCFLHLLIDSVLQVGNSRLNDICMFSCICYQIIWRQYPISQYCCHGKVPISPSSCRSSVCISP